jgi:hypothetical protein
MIMNAFPAGQPGPKELKEKPGSTHEIWDGINRHIRVLQNSTDNPAKSFKEIVAPTSACGDLAICECYDKQVHSLTAGQIRLLFIK